MREILFRGKRLDSGEWVEGAFYKQLSFYGDPCEACVIITTTEDLEYDQALEHYDVDMETVGQYTGLLDKNGKRIFEGDIVDLRGSGACGFNRNEAVRYEGGGFTPFAVPGWECTPKLDKVEIIGNIHDNPELLEV